MLQSALRRAVPSLLRQGGALGPAARQLATQPPQEPEDDDTYVLLPPGCSMADPTHGRSFGGNRNSLSDPVLIYDSKPAEEYRPVKKKPLPAPPLNVAAAQAKLQERKDAKKQAKAAKQDEEDDDDVYVYLPPGSSMRDPVALPNSMSDPLENRKVYYRDPSPTIRSK